MVLILGRDVVEPVWRLRFLTVLAKRSRSPGRHIEERTVGPRCVWGEGREPEIIIVNQRVPLFLQMHLST